MGYRQCLYQTITAFSLNDTVSAGGKINFSVHCKNCLTKMTAIDFRRAPPWRPGLSKWGGGGLDGKTRNTGFMVSLDAQNRIP